MPSLAARRALGAAACAAVALAAVPADEVTSLPGWTGPLPSKMYSGFVDAGWDVWEGVNRTMHMWYVFQEAEEAPASKPVLLWSNGGPGASSAFGMLTEWGPLQLSTESLAYDPPRLFYNPYAWTKFFNVVILNGPAPVGYSWCSPAGPTGDGYSCGSWNDTRTADFNVKFVNSFFKLYPEYLSNGLYIIGESFAGVYASMIVEGLLAAPPAERLPLRGVGYVDTCMGTEVICGPGPGGPWLDLLFSFGQGCISYATFDAMLTECPLNTLKHGPMATAPPACKAAVAKAANDCPSGAYNGYFYLDQCPPFNFNRSSVNATVSAGGDPAPPTRPGGYACGGDQGLKAWIERPDVKAALHVAPDSNFNSFDNGVGFVYNLTYASAIPLLRRLQTGADGVRVLFMNGENDPSISSIKTQNFTMALGFPLVEDWRPWTYPPEVNSGIVAGQVRRWAGGITHASVRGAGHEIPTFKPYSAYLLMRYWVRDNDNWPALLPSAAEGARKE